MPSEKKSQMYLRCKYVCILTLHRHSFAGQGRFYNTQLAGLVSCVVQGSGWKVDPKSPEAKLMVRFWVPPFLPLFPVSGDYWVMDLDKEGYSYALVGQPSRKFLWVSSRLWVQGLSFVKIVIYIFGRHQGLENRRANDRDESQPSHSQPPAFSYPFPFVQVLSRTPEMGEEVYSALLDTAKGQGYDTSLLQKTEHRAEEASSVSASDGGAWWLRALYGK